MDLGLVPFWLFGVWLLVWPKSVWRFYHWFHGPDVERRNPPGQTRHIRNAGIFLIVMVPSGRRSRAPAPREPAPSKLHAPARLTTTAVPI